MKRLVAIVGPTAAGKSRLALALACHLAVEIVSADSRQVYRHLDIGTAKPTREERAQVPHHLIDVVNPDEDFSLALYLSLVHEALEGIWSRGRLPLLAGGTGLYIWALLEGWQVPPVPPQKEWRRQMEERAAREGTESLYHELQAADPEAAQRIDPRNLRRLIRALEVLQVSGHLFSQQQRRQPPSFPVLILGLDLPREELYRRIDARVDSMVARGWVEEVRSLLQRGYDLELPAMNSPGYREIGLFLQGKMSLETALEKAKFATHRLARHQYAWFRPADRRISWFDVLEEAVESRVLDQVKTFLKETSAEGGSTRVCSPVPLAQ